MSYTFNLDEVLDEPVRRLPRPLGAQQFARAGRDDMRRQLRLERHVLCLEGSAGGALAQALALGALVGHFTGEVGLLGRERCA